jgi:hypothetical protein
VNPIAGLSLAGSRVYNRVRPAHDLPACSAGRIARRLRPRALQSRRRARAVGRGLRADSFPGWSNPTRSEPKPQAPSGRGVAPPREIDRAGSPTELDREEARGESRADRRLAPQGGRARRLASSRRPCESRRRQSHRDNRHRARESPVETRDGRDVAHTLITLSPGPLARPRSRPTGCGALRREG